MSLCSPKAHGHVTRATLCGNFRKNTGPQSRAPHFVRAYAVETHMDISEEPFCAVICTKHAGPRFVRACPVNTSIEHRAFRVAILFGEKM